MNNQKEAVVEIRKSSIHGLGAYAKRAFEPGEIVLRWNLSNIISKEELSSLPAEERVYIHPIGENEILLVQAPERFVNHSCHNNTVVENYCDVAITYINPSEEITSDYSSDGSGSKFTCFCGAENCRRVIG